MGWGVCDILLLLLPFVSLRIVTAMLVPLWVVVVVLASGSGLCVG